MSFEAELIGFSLALGTNDVVTGKQSIVVSLEQFVRVTQLGTSHINMDRRTNQIFVTLCHMEFSNVGGVRFEMPTRNYLVHVIIGKIYFSRDSSEN